MHIGVRSSTGDVDEVIQRVLATYLVPDLEAPGNYSVRIGGHEGDTKGRNLHLLYRSNTLVARSRAPSRILRSLVYHLASHRPERSELLRSTALALVSEQGAVLAPRALLNGIEALQPRLERSGMRIVDTPDVLIDPARVELVVPPSPLEVDEEALRSLDTRFPSSGREPPFVEPGRYPLRSWAILRGADDVGPVSRAIGVASAVQTIETNGLSAQETLDALVGVFNQASAHAIWYSKVQEVVPQLVDLAS